MDNKVSNLEEIPKVEEVKEGSAALYGCDLCDSEVVHKTAQVFLPGLASACVDNTSGDLFKSPASVAADIRKEMVEYLTQRSETFVAETLMQEGAPEVTISEHPTDIIADFVDDFASLKRNLFSRVSGWVLSEKREDKIDDFVQEMEINRFWLMDRREDIARLLLKNVDYKSTFHCHNKFDTSEELEQHRKQCIYRSMNCTNEGCNASFCAFHIDNHDSVCPFKILQCEQKCSASLVRREMDRHCITVCPMKLVNCPFYPVGCRSTIPLCTINQHCSEFLHAHLLYILQAIHKEGSEEDLKHRVEQLEQSWSVEELCDTEDLRFLTRIVRQLDAKMGPLVHHVTSTLNEECTETANAQVHRTEEENHVPPEEAVMQVQISREPIHDKPEANIQVQGSQELTNAEADAEVQVKTSQEPNSDKPDTKTQVKTSQEPFSEQPEEDIQMQTSREPISNKMEAPYVVQTPDQPSSDKSVEEIQFQTSQEPVGNVLRVDIQLPTSPGPISDKLDAQTSPEPVSYKLEAENQVKTSHEPISGKPKEEFQMQTSPESMGNVSKVDIQLPTSPKSTNDKVEAEIQVETSQEPVSYKLEGDNQVKTSHEPVSGESEVNIQGQTSQEPVIDKSKADIPLHSSQEVITDKSDF